MEYELDFNDIKEILDDYKIKYKIINPKGRVNYNIKEITINPLYNQDIDTLFHEFTHIYYDEVLGIEGLFEEEIENISQNFLNNNKNIKNSLEDYLYKRIENK